MTVLALTFIVGLGYTGGFPWEGVASGVAVKVNGDSVPLSYYRYVRGRIYESRTENLDKVPVDLQDAIDFLSLSFVIERKLLAQKARALGFRVADEVVAEAVRNNPGFHLDGSFGGPEYYKQAVARGMGMTPGTFEEALRDEALRDRLFAFSQVSSGLSERELANLFDVTGAKISVEFVSFETPGEAEDALAALRASGDIGAVAEKFGRGTEKTPFFTRFEARERLGPGGWEMFAVQSPGAPGKRVFSSDGAHRVAVLSARKGEEPETVLRKVRIAMRDAELKKAGIFNNWVQRLYAAAEVETNKELLR